MSQSTPPISAAAAPGEATSPGAASATIDRALNELEALATALEGQPEALLSLLRSLEQLHRSIQDGPFRASLPADRNALFQLLSEMERSGGWPYIPRLQLRTFLDLLGSGGDGEAPASAGVLSEVAAAEDGPGESPRLAA